MEQIVTAPAKRTIIYREAAGILALGGPLIVHNLAMEGMQFTDVLMSGRLSAKALAAVAVGGSLWMPVFLFVMGVLMALNPIVAQLYGAGRNKAIGRYAGQAFWLSQALAWSCLLLLRHAAPFLHALGIEPEIVPIAAGYLKAIAWGLPGAALYHVLRFITEGIGHTRPMLFIALAGLAVNIAADYAFIYGAWGLPRLGAVGCGFATALVLWLMSAGLLVYMLGRARYRKFALFSAFKPPIRALQWELIGLGGPIAIAMVMEVGLFAAVSLIMGGLGTDIVAAHQIAANFAAMMFMVPLGLSNAISVREGQALGRDAPGDARMVGLVGIGLCIGFMAVSAIFMRLAPGLIAGWYTDNPQVRHIAVQLLGMAAIFQLSDGFQVSGAGALRGFKDTRTPMLMTVFAYWLVGFPLAYLLGVHWQLGPRLVWAGLIAGLTMAALLLNLRFLKISRTC
jgi:MATE family multidrug resistance protein